MRRVRLISAVLFLAACGISLVNSKHCDAAERTILEDSETLKRHFEKLSEDIRKLKDEVSRLRAILEKPDSVDVASRRGEVSFSDGKKRTFDGIAGVRWQSSSRGRIGWRTPAAIIVTEQDYSEHEIPLLSLTKMEIGKQDSFLEVTFHTTEGRKATIKTRADEIDIRWSDGVSIVRTGLDKFKGASITFAK